MPATDKRVSDTADQINVLTFGAKGDGVTDDRPAIQAAIDTGRDVLFPEGHTFLLGAALMVSTPGQSLSGGGRLLADGAEGETVVDVSAEGVRIEGLDISRRKGK